MDVLWMSTQFIDTLTKIGDANPLMMKCCNGYSVNHLYYKVYIHIVYIYIVYIQSIFGMSIYSKYMYKTL